MRLKTENALRACEAHELRACKTHMPRFTDFFTDFEKKLTVLQSSGPVKGETKIKQLSTAQTKQQQYHSIYDVAN